MSKPIAKLIQQSVYSCTALFTGLLGVAALLDSAPSASASPEVYARATSTVIGHGDSLPQTATSGSVSDFYVGDDDIGATSQVQASASFASLQAYATTAMTSGSSASSRFSTSNAAFKDDFFIDKLGLTGTAGTVKVRFTISGTVSALASGTPSGNASVLMNSTYAHAQYGFGIGIGYGDTSATYRLYGDGHTTGTPFLGIQQEVVLGFTFGTLLSDVTLNISGSNAAAARFTEYTSETTTNLTTSWGGFVEVRDSGGNLVTGYTSTSTSGANYAAPVPEPGAVSLLLVSGLAFGAVRSRRRPAVSA